MAYSLGFSKLIQYDPGLPGISIPVRIGVSREVSVVADAKVDTGSTYCIFSREVAESLGLDVEGGLAVPIRTATGSFLSFQHEVTLTVGEFEMIALCGFAAHAGFQRNVLGRHGFLMRTKLGIDDYNGLLYLDRNA